MQMIFRSFLATLVVPFIFLSSAYLQGKVGVGEGSEIVKQLQYINALHKLSLLLN